MTKEIKMNYRDCSTAILNGMMFQMMTCWKPGSQRERKSWKLFSMSKAHTGAIQA